MKNLLKNKIFIILFFTIGIIFCLNNKSKASFDFTYNDVEYSVQDLPFDTEEYPYYIVCHRSKNPDISVQFQDFYYYSSEPFTIVNSTSDGNDNITQIWFTSSSEFFTTCYLTYNNQNTFSNPDRLSANSNQSIPLSYNGGTTSFFTSSDLRDTNNNVVFQGAPQEEQGRTLILTPIVEQEETQQEMNKTLQQILTLLPIVMIIVVSCLALRKGLALLFRILRQS